MNGNTSNQILDNPNTQTMFIDSNGDKLFHLQMKGSGKKYVSGYHAMMFHIYKTF